jgi:hypothetical protein
MYVAIRQYGLLTNEPVDKVLQGIREGFIPIIKNHRGFWPITHWIAGVARSPQ